MKVSTKGRYALRVMIDLAVNNTGAFIPLRDIADRQDITIKYLEQIILQLNRAGYLKSHRGNSGGYKLAKSPAEYKIGDILRATEGSLAPVSCIDDCPNECSRSPACASLYFWEGLNRVIQEYVDGVTLEQLVEKQKEMSGNTYYI